MTEESTERDAELLIVGRGARSEAAPVIVAGDLNDRLGEPALRRIRGRDDFGIDLVQTWAVEYYHETDKWPERWSYDFRGSRECIDHVLPSLNLLQRLLPQDEQQVPRGITAEALPVTEALPGGRPASDHRPFVITLRFK